MKWIRKLLMKCLQSMVHQRVCSRVKQLKYVFSTSHCLAYRANWEKNWKKVSLTEGGRKRGQELTIRAVVAVSPSYAVACFGNVEVGKRELFVTSV